MNLDPCQRYFSTNLPPVSLFITFIIDKSTKNVSQEIFFRKKNFVFWSLVKMAIFERFLQKKKLGISKLSTEKVRFLNFELLWPSDLDRKLAGTEISSHFREIFFWDFRSKKTLSCLYCLRRCYFFGMKYFLAFSNAVKFRISAVFCFLTGISMIRMNP